MSGRVPGSAVGRGADAGCRASALAATCATVTSGGFPRWGASSTSMTSSVETTSRVSSGWWTWPPARADVSNVFDLSDRLSHSRPMERCLVALGAIGLGQDVEGALRGPLYDLSRWREWQVLARVDLWPGVEHDGLRSAVLSATRSFAGDAAYVNFRVYKTHDIHHVLTGFSLDDLGRSASSRSARPSSGSRPSCFSACWVC
jgi:hypothetical protein